MSVVMEMTPCRGPVCCWCHARASLASRGTPFCRTWRYERWAPQEWLVVVTGHVETCPLPSSVRSLTSASSFHVHGSKGGRASTGFAPLPNGDRASLGSGGMELPPLGSGEALLAPKGSEVPNLHPRGRASQNLPSGDRTKPRSCPLAVRLILIIGEHEFHFFGYPKIGT
jgi:hypothetical protein